MGKSRPPGMGTAEGTERPMYSGPSHTQCDGAMIGAQLMPSQNGFTTECTILGVSCTFLP